MKTSNKILVITAISILLISAIAVVSTGIFLFYDNPHLIKFGKGSGNLLNKEYPCHDFNSIMITGFWNVKIVQDSDFGIRVSAPEYLMEYISINTSDQVLKIDQLFFTDIPPGGPDVLISMPVLSEIKSDVSVEIVFSGFKQEEMAIVTNGFSRITGNNSRIKNLSVSGNGIMGYDLNECPVVNACLELTGSGPIALNIAGGVLSGHVKGKIDITYMGNISEQKIILYEDTQLRKKEH